MDAATIEKRAIDVPVDATSPREDAYASHLKLVLSTIVFKRKDFRELFSEEEITIAERVLSVLKPLEQQVYARLLQRQGPWYRTISLFRYFDQHEPSIKNDQVQDVVRVMVDAGFLQQFPVKTTTKHLPSGQELEHGGTAFDAIKQCATAPELGALYKKMTGSKKHIAKTDLMAAVKKVVKTQRRIDGSKIPVAELMQKIWLESYPLAGKQSSDVMALRLTPAIRNLMLQMHRLFYLVSTPPFNATSLMPPQLNDVAQLIALASHKLRYEPTQWPGLMVFFNKVAYPDYQVPSSDNSPTETLSSHRVFPSSETYVCYEVAQQLHRMMKIIEQCIHIVTPDKAYKEPELELKWILSDDPPVFLAFHRLVAAVYEDKMSPESVAKGPYGKTKVETVGSWQMQSWEYFYSELKQLQSLDDVVLATRGCLHAYIKWTKAAAYSTSGIPVFFAKCNAGYHLVRILHMAVGMYEKMRKYQIATLLLNDLLASPFLERKRGYWWDRLALNLEHLKCTDQARDTCVNALADPHVLATARISLERRQNRLDRQDERKRVELQSTASHLLQKANMRSLSSSIDGSNDDKDKTLGAEPHACYEYRKNYVVGRPLNRQTGEKSRFVGYDDEACTVEQVVLQYYRDHYCVPVHDSVGESSNIGGWYGVHSEGMVVGNLFGILFWDILYANIPDVFQTPFQSAPLDFGYADLFYATRRDLIERRFAQVATDWTREEMLTVFATRWKAEFGKVSRFVRWPTDDVASLHFHLLAIRAIGRLQLVKLLRYMATSKEYHQAQNGLPDLFLMRIELGKGAEVSWPTDRHGCLNIFAFCGMDEELNMNEKRSALTLVRELDNTDEMIAKDQLELPPLQHVLALLKEEDFVARAKVVEVKGPRDRLSDKQLLWLHVLCTQVGLDASVMHVEEPEKRVKRKAKERAKATANGVQRKRSKA